MKIRALLLILCQRAIISFSYYNLKYRSFFSATKFSGGGCTNCDIPAMALQGIDFDGKNPFQIFTACYVLKINVT